MARPLEFDRAEALSRATGAFWQDGYQHVSAAELAEAMGVAKSSLYNTFGSKRDLFIEAVGHFAEQQRAKISKMATHANVVHQLREMLLDVARHNECGRGCLLVNTATEIGERDPVVNRQVQEGFDRLEQGISELIRCGQANGQIDPAIDPQRLAIILLAGIAGLRVLAQAGFSERRLMPVVDGLLRHLVP
jgi:TetR/AcrR family transcriptional repressor of nem operon